MRAAPVLACGLRAIRARHMHSESATWKVLSRIRREPLAKADAMDSTPAGGAGNGRHKDFGLWEREESAYNGHFESTCYHPLLLFNGEGDCLAAKFDQTTCIVLRGMRSFCQRSSAT